MAAILAATVIDGRTVVAFLAGAVLVLVLRR